MQNPAVAENKNAAADKRTSGVADDLERLEQYRAAVEYDLMKYRLATDALQIALWDTDVVLDDPVNPKNKATWSQEFRSMLGFCDENDFPGELQSWSHRLHPEDKERVLHAVSAHINDYTGKTPYDIEYRLQLKNGDYRYFHAFGNTLRDSKGVPLKFAGAMMDIDEKKRMAKALEDALTQSNITLDHMKNVLDKSGTMIFVTDPATDEILFITDTIKKIEGIEGDIAGQICYKMMRGMEQRCDFCPCLQLDKEPGGVIVREEHDAKTDRYLRHTSRYVDWPDGRKVHVQHIVDLTDVRRAQESIEYRDRLIQAVNQASFILLNSDLDSFADDLIQGMKVVAEAVTVDRIRIWKNHVQGGKLYRIQTYEWTAGVPHSKETAVTEPYSEIFSGWEKPLSEGESISTLVRDMSEAEQVRLSAQGILSFLVVPVFIKDQFWGCVAFYTCRREKVFTEEEEEILRSVAHTFVNSWIRAEMEKEIALTEQRLRLMLDTSPICCQIWDNNLNTIDCNEAAVKLYGFKDKQEYVEKFLTECSPEYQPCGQRSSEKAAILVNKAFAEGRCAFDWMHQIPRDGSLMPAEIILIRVEYVNDYVVVGYTRDLREHKKMMDEIGKTLFELQEANQAKSDFLSRMSHEMLTPMNAIMGMTQLIKTNIHPEKTSSYLDEIDFASQHLLGLIYDLLDVDRKKDGTFNLVKSELVPSDFLFNQMLQESLKKAQRQIVEKQQTLNTDIDSSIPKKLVGDAKRLAQVISNLLENAVKFTPKQGEIHFSVGVLNEDNEAIILQFTVTDNGIGIPKEKQSGIFQIFEQVDGSVSRKYGGAGLGLPLSKRIAEKMGGNMWVESELGKGATFSFTCQLQKGFG